MSESSLQDRYAPHNACFGCGPANEKGLRIKSRVEGEQVVAHCTPQPHHQAFPGVLNGGIIGALLDCHCNWTAAWPLMKRAGAETPPCTVTADYAIKLLKRPTPMDARSCSARRSSSRGRPRGGRGHARGERQGHRDLPRARSSR